MNDEEYKKLRGHIINYPLSNPHHKKFENFLIEAYKLEIPYKKLMLFVDEYVEIYKSYHARANNRHLLRDFLKYVAEKENTTFEEFTDNIITPAMQKKILLGKLEKLAEN